MPVEVVSVHNGQLGDRRVTKNMCMVAGALCSGSAAGAVDVEFQWRSRYRAAYESTRSHVQVPVVDSNIHGDGFRLLGLVKVTHRGAGYYIGPATHWNVEGASG